MSRPRELRAAIIKRLADARIGLRQVKAHAGRYTVDDLKRLHGVAPAAAVGLVAVSKPVSRASGEVQVTLDYAAVIVTRGAKVEVADDEAIDLAVSAAVILSGWVPATEVARCQPAANIHAEAVADEEVESAGLCVWALLWSHTVVIGVDEVGTTIDDAHRLAADATVTIVGGQP